MVPVSDMVLSALSTMSELILFSASIPYSRNPRRLRGRICLRHPDRGSRGMDGPWWRRCAGAVRRCPRDHIGQLSTHTMVRLPGRGAVEEMAGATASWRKRVPLDPPQRDSQAPSASPGADPVQAAPAPSATPPTPAAASGRPKSLSEADRLFSAHGDGPRRSTPSPTRPPLRPRARRHPLDRCERFQVTFRPPFQDLSCRKQNLPEIAL